MGKRHDKPNISSISVDVASLDSIDGLHGRMDFFGMDAKNLCNHLHQKLKVVQTWVFIQAILIVLLIAYTAVLGVWLSPFFPMNYADTTVEGRVITLSGLQSDVSKIQKSVHSSNGSVDYLQVWQKEHEDTHISLNKVVEDIAKQIEAGTKLDKHVTELTIQNGEQKKEISTLQSKIIDLERIIRNIRSEGVDKIDQHNVRIRKLECTTDNLTSTLDNFANSTKNQFCDVVEEIGSTIERVNVIERQVQNEIAHDVGELQYDVGVLETSMSNVTKELNKTKSRQMMYEKRTRDKFIEQDDLRGTALEKQRVMVYAKVGKLECKLDELHGALNDRIEHIMLNVTPGIEICINQKINATQQYLEEKISDLTEQMKEDIDHAETEFQEGMRDLGDSIVTERKERAAQFVHVCEMVEGVESNASEMFRTVEWEAFQNKKHVDDLLESVSHLEKAEAENSDNVASLNVSQQTQRLTFVQFREETIHTGIDMTNRMCTVESGLQDMTAKTAEMDTRLGTAETTMQNMPNDIRVIVTESSAKTTEQMANLKADNDNLRGQVETTSKQLAQFARDFGLGSLDSLQTTLRTASSSSGPLTTGTATKSMDANVPMSDDVYNGEPVPPDEYIYTERE